MKARELEELVKRDRESCANHWLTTCTAEEAEAVARRTFPAGSLPGDTAQFTLREIDIVKLLIWQTAEMRDRVLDAITMAALERGGATFSQ